MTAHGRLLPVEGPYRLARKQPFAVTGGTWLPRVRLPARRMLSNTNRLYRNPPTLDAQKFLWRRDVAVMRKVDDGFRHKWWPLRRCRGDIAYRTLKQHRQNAGDSYGRASAPLRDEALGLLDALIERRLSG